MLSYAPARSGLSNRVQPATIHQLPRASVSPSQACPLHTSSWLLKPATTGLQRRKLRPDVHAKRPTVRASAQAERVDGLVQHNGFEWATNVSRHGNVYFAIDETSQACRAGMSNNSPDPTVALFFASSSYSVEFDRIIPVLRSKVPSLQHIIGCTVCSLAVTHPSCQQKYRPDVFPHSLGRLPEWHLHCKRSSNT